VLFLKRLQILVYICKNVGNIGGRGTGIPTGITKKGGRGMKSRVYNKVI